MGAGGQDGPGNAGAGPEGVGTENGVGLWNL